MQFVKKHHARFGWQMPKKLDARNIEHFLAYYHSALLSYDLEYVYTMDGDRYPPHSYFPQEAFVLLRAKAAGPHSYPHVSPIAPWVSPWDANLRSQPPKPEPPPTMEIDISKNNEREAQEPTQHNVEPKDPEVEAGETNGTHVSNSPVSALQHADNTNDVDDQSTDSESDGEHVVQKTAREIVSICTTDEDRTDPLDCLPQRGTPPDSKGYAGRKRAEPSTLSQPQTQTANPPKRKVTILKRIPKKQEVRTPNGKSIIHFLITHT